MGQATGTRSQTRWQRLTWREAGNLLGVCRGRLQEMAWEALRDAMPGAAAAALEAEMHGRGVRFELSGHEVWINRPSRVFVVRVREMG